MKTHLLFFLLPLISLAGILTVRGSQAGVAEIFSKGMVLQRDVPIPVWGTAPDGTPVTVTFGGSKATGTAAGGNWKVELAAQQASSEPQTMTIQLGDNPAIAIEDVVVGEVWLCAGQSNMDQRISKKAPRAIADMPLVRQFSKARGKNATQSNAWVAATGERMSEMSVTAVYFAENLFKELKVPVGLILTAVSGTPIESWTPKNAIEADPELNALMVKANAERERLTGIRQAMRDQPEDAINPEDEVLLSFSKPGTLYAAHIQPTLPFPVRGVIWYQGEANSKTAGNAAMYGRLLTALVSALRNAYGMPELPFYLVQLPSIEEVKNKRTRYYEVVREQQRRFVQSTPNTGLAVSIDVNEGLHPRSKNTMGDRLAVIALASTYDRKPKTSSAGALLKSVSLEDGGAVCTFEGASGGLVLKEGAADLFELAGSDGVYHPAKATVEGETLTVRSEQVKEPKSVRYAFKSAMPSVSLFDGQGVPASPFVHP
jgi:hypothetical protein